MITEELKNAIAESGESPYAVSKNTGIPYPSIWHFVYGESLLSGKTINTLCDYYGLSLRPVKTTKKTQSK